MAGLPKLKIVKFPFGYPREEILDLEDARYRISYSDQAAILVEGHPVQSYDEIVEMINQGVFKDKDVLEVMIVTEFIGGG